MRAAARRVHYSWQHFKQCYWSVGRDEDRYINTRIRFKKIIKQIKIEDWKDKISKLNLQDQSLWNYYKICTRRRLPPLPLKNFSNDFVYDETSKVNLLADTFQSIHTDSTNQKSPHEEIANQITQEVQNSDSQIEYPDYIPQNLLIIINSLRNNKAFRNDKIIALHLKNFPKKLLIQLYYILQTIFKLNYFLKIWKIVIVIPISKPRKKRNCSKSYRPVNLLSILGKILEKIIFN